MIEKKVKEEVAVTPRAGADLVDFPPDGLIQRFADLYAGNPRSCGQYDPETAKMFTKPQGPEARDFDAHFAGVTGLGVVPILDDDTCEWAAIDIDCHGDGEGDIDIAKIDEIIRNQVLPLVPCRSKSGGVHAYMFMDKPQPAVRIKVLLARWAGVLGFPGCEVFPKQARLASAKGPKQQGNWINLPYFAGIKTDRYAFRDGQKLDLAGFLDLAESKLVTDADLKLLMMAEHGEAPPCVYKMMLKGVASGVRNEALYNTVIYLKKAFPTEYEARAWEMNGLLFAKPLGRSEVTRTITSAARPEYSYRCNEEPIHSLCDREACLKKKCGITDEEAFRNTTNETLPLFTDLTKYLTEPTRWEITMNGVRISNISTPVLLEWRAMREIIADRLTRVVPLIKPGEWDRILQPLMAEARIIDVPDDASVTGVIRDRLREFAAKTNLMSKGEDTNDRKALLRGMPVVQVVDGERAVIFRAQDFVNYLKRAKAEELKGVNLFFAVRDIGVGHARMRAGNANINVWYLPIREVLRHSSPIDEPSFETEI